VAGNNGAGAELGAKGRGAGTERRAGWLTVTTRSNLTYKEPSRIVDQVRSDSIKKFKQWH